MPKHNQSATLGSMSDFVTTTPAHEPDTDRITALEKRVATLELLLNDVMHQLDKPNTQPKSKVNGNPKGNGKPKVQKSRLPPTPKPKQAKAKTPPSEIITALLKQNPQSRAEIESETGMDTEAVTKCVTWMKKRDLIEKTTDTDTDGNSKWRRKQ